MTIDEHAADFEAWELDAARDAQRLHLRRILACFIVVVVLLPFAGIGGVLSILLVPLVLVAAWGFREAVRLRRSVNRWGALR